MTRRLKKKNITKVFIATTIVLAIALAIANYVLSNNTRHNFSDTSTKQY